MCDDVASLVAERVTASAGGLTWDWDDIAAAAAVLRHASPPFLRALSDALWRAVAAADPETQAKACPLRNTCVGTRKEHLLSLARAARVAGVTSRTPLCQLSKLLNDAGDMPVGSRCPVPIKAALGVLNLRWRWVNASVARKMCRGVQLEGCREMGAPYGGARLLLRDIRLAVRRVSGFDDGCYRSQRLAKINNIVRMLERSDVEQRRMAELVNAIDVHGMPAELARSQAATRFRYRGEPATVDMLIAQMQEALDVLQAAGLASRMDWLGEDLVASARRAVRREALEEALGARGLTLRADSHVCRMYIHGTRDDLDAVVEVMDEMRFYYERTAYPRLLRQRQYHYIGSDGDSDEDVDDPVAASQAAKAAALMHAGSVHVTAPSNVQELARRLGIPERCN